MLYYIVETTRQFRQLGTPLTVTVTRAARQQAHINGCGLLPKKKNGVGWELDTPVTE